MSQMAHLQLNIFGPLITKNEIPDLLNLDQKIGAKKDFLEFKRGALQSFFNLPFNTLNKEILERYCEVTDEKTYLSIVPHSEDIYDSLLTPLILAKKYYCLGESISAIAISGIIGEMLALLLWKINEVKFKKERLEESDEEILFGYTFEKLGQERRLKILKIFSFINDTQFTSFLSIKNTRNRYLHVWQTHGSNIQNDALRLTVHVFSLFKEIADIGLADAGTVSMDARLLKYLNDHRPKDEK